MKRRESPYPRTNPSGERVWVARYTDAAGKRRNAGTRKLRREAQALIDAAYGVTAEPSEAVGAYAATWTARHPRAARTNATNDHRIGRVLDIEVFGQPLRDWPFRELRRKHALELVAAMLVEQGRSQAGALNILRTLSAMAEDAITDDVADVNAFKGVKVRASDPRIRKQPKTRVVLSFEQMHDFAAAAGKYEPMIRVLADCGPRLGELLGLERRDFDGEALHFRGSAHEGVFIEGNQATKKHVRSSPVPPTTAALLRAMPARIDTPLLFPSPEGKIWRESNWRRRVFDRVKALEDGGRLVFPWAQGVTPHGFRHSWESHLHAAGVNPADLADMAGHTLETMHKRYVHPLRQSHEAVRALIG